MKRLLTLFLTLALLAGIAIAESSSLRDFTVDEQAYDVYLDISYVHNQSIRYISEFGRLWGLANDLNSITDVNETWFHTGFVADFGNSDIESISRLATFQQFATVKYGYSSIPELYPVFKELLSEYTGKTTDIIWAALNLGVEAHYLISPDELKTYMDDAMQGIRSIMSMDREYPFLKDLQSYYKEASYLLDYITDFKDNYIGLNEMLDTQKKNQSSYTIDFEFIFDPADFDYVMEVEAVEAEEREKAIYDRAVSLENSGDYAEAIDLYWQCYHYEDSANKIIYCHSASKALESETKYQEALAKKDAGHYEEAYLIFIELGEYRDSSMLANACKDMVCANSVLIKTNERTYYYTTGGLSSEVSYLYSYDENNQLISMERISDLPYSEEYTLNDNGQIIQGKQVGQWSSDERRTYVSTIDYNEFGDPRQVVTIYHSYDNWLYKDGDIYTVIYEYTYSDTGEMLSETKYSNAKKIYSYTYEYLYNEHNQLIGKTQYKDSKPLIHYAYYYDEFDLLTKIVREPVNPDKTSSIEVYTEITYAYKMSK